MWEVGAEFPGCYAGDSVLAAVGRRIRGLMRLFVRVELGADLQEVRVGSPGGCGEFCHCGLVVQVCSKRL